VSQATNGDDILADSLLNLLTALGERAATSSWLCSGVEAYGRNANELHICSDRQQRMGGQDLLRIVSGLDTIAEGYFHAYRHSDTQPWLVIRTIDDTVFEIESHDPAVDQIKRDQRRKAAQAAPAPSAESMRQSSTTAGEGQAPTSGWDPLVYAQEMRKSTSPVSAFFLIDSLEAIAKCMQWLSILDAYNTASSEHLRYFDDVRDNYASGRKVINFDHDFKLNWKDKELSGVLRCHSVDVGRYEIELWLPGVIANELADNFGDGRGSFFCAFLPPLFYD
jgi:hypothetical protein